MRKEGKEKMGCSMLSLAMKTKHEEKIALDLPQALDPCCETVPFVPRYRSGLHVSST